MLASSKMKRGLGKGFSKECKQLYSYLKIQTCRLALFSQMVDYVGLSLFGLFSF